MVKATAARKAKGNGKRGPAVAKAKGKAVVTARGPWKCTAFKGITERGGLFTAYCGGYLGVFTSIHDAKQ